jgi:hypothetical protein
LILERIYLAAMYSRRAEMEVIADELKQHGYEITARWVYGGEENLDLEGICFLDLEDVLRADTVISFTHTRNTMLPTGGGRHVEFGYGLAHGKRMVLIGPRENVFHSHPKVEVYDNIDSWITANKKEAA